MASTSAQVAVDVVMLTHQVHRLATYNRSDFTQFDEIILENILAQDEGRVEESPL